MYGAEWGVWRIDQTAFAYQGYGGLYDQWWGKGRMQQPVDKFALIKYEDRYNNGFFDKILYDLNGDKIFEDSVSFAAIGLSDTQMLFSSEAMPIGKAQEKCKVIVNNSWQRSQQAIVIAEKVGLSTDW